MPRLGAQGPEHYVQATTPNVGAPGDTWYDGTETRIYDRVNGWRLPDVRVAAITRHIGDPQLRMVENVQGLSATGAGGTAISGLSASLAASAIYQVEGRLLYYMSAADAFGVALEFPAMVRAAGTIQGFNAVGVSAPLAAHFNEKASTSIVYSAIVGTATSSLAVDIEALFATSAAGTLQVMARVSATTKPANIQRGSYLRAFKIG